MATYKRVRGKANGWVYKNKDMHLGVTGNDNEVICTWRNDIQRPTMEIVGQNLSTQEVYKKAYEWGCPCIEMVE